MLSYNWALSLAIRTFHVHARFHSDFFAQLLLLVIHSSHIFAIATRRIFAVTCRLFGTAQPAIRSVSTFCLHFDAIVSAADSCPAFDSWPQSDLCVSPSNRFVFTFAQLNFVGMFSLLGMVLFAHMFCNQCRYQRIKFFTPNVSAWSCYRRSDSCSELTLWFRYLFQTMKLDLEFIVCS